MIYRRIIILFIAILSCTFLLAQEKGMASFYSNRLHGRRMSDGSRYHRDSLTCAHARYPLGSHLKVTNINNGESVVVRVADRCASSRRRIIDLSYAAAKEIGIVAAGVAMVRVEKCKPDLVVPYRADDEKDLPEIDYEVTLGDDMLTPAWIKDKKSHSPAKGNGNIKNIRK